MLKNVLACVGLTLLVSCGKDAKPKPYGELRLEYPQPHYVSFDSKSPFTFEYSDLAAISPAKKENWYNMSYKGMKANVFITYFPIHNDFKLHVKEVEKMVYEHTIKASAIDTKSFSYPQQKVFGNFYELEGQSASNIQFFVKIGRAHV